MRLRKRIEIGQRFGRLVILRDLGSRRIGTSLRPHVEAACDCGAVVQLLESNVRIGKTRSCGCLKAEATAARNTTHGMSGTFIYSVWCNMHRRCSDPTSKSYPDYGGRGIKICDQWKDFSSFYADMGMPPSSNYTIDRIDNDGDYEPRNCRWASRKQQAANTRTTKNVVLNGVEMPFSLACQTLGYSSAALRTMAKRRQWPYQRAVEFYANRPKAAFHSNGRPKTKTIA